MREIGTVFERATRSPQRRGTRPKQRLPHEKLAVPRWIILKRAKNLVTLAHIKRLRGRVECVQSGARRAVFDPHSLGRRQQTRAEAASAQRRRDPQPLYMQIV